MLAEKQGKTNVKVPASDERRIEMLAKILRSFGGSQSAKNERLRSVLEKTSEAQPDAAADGIVAIERRCVGDETADLVWQLAQTKSREILAFMNRSVSQAV